MRTVAFSTRRLVTSAAALALLVGGLAVSTADEAGAVACTSPAWSNKSNIIGTPLSDGTPVRKGPAGDCDLVWNALTGTQFRYHCYVTDSAGNAWTHVRPDDVPGLSGWVLNSQLDYGGSSLHC